MRETIITSVVGRRVWDSRGLPTVEAEVHLASGALGRAIAPAGRSRGSKEAVDLRDGGPRLGGQGVDRAVNHVNCQIAQRLRGVDAAGQEAVDQALIEMDQTSNKSYLGANATTAVSMAVAHAAAAAAGLPLYQYLGGKNAAQLPLPEIQIFGGGAHASRRVDIQDFMVAALSARNFDEALSMAADVYYQAGKLMTAAGKLYGVADEGGFWPAFHSNEEAIEHLVAAIEAAGYVPGEDMGILLDVAASQFYSDGRYRLGLDQRELDSDGLSEILCDWSDRFPIVSLEDPLGETDTEGLRRLTLALGSRLQIVGDDYLVTDAERIAAAARAGVCNAVLLKPNQSGTLTETNTAFQAACVAGWRSIVSARSGETEDVTIVHLAVGWGVGQLKVGAFARSERMAKWNEALRIEAALGGRATFAGRAALRGSRKQAG